MSSAEAIMLPGGLRSLVIGELLDAYHAKRFSVTELLNAVLARIDDAPERHVWIARLSREQVLAYAKALDATPPDSLPLYGVPFAIKDNIDLTGVPTTAGCPDYAYTPRESAFVVQRLIDAGAVPIGKTNLDQFATGLVGTRSPYGACQNAFDAAYVSGGSSSGSAVAVASGLVSFSLGTDTAGSGRVPAAFNNIIGLKPTCGNLSARGVVPACRSIDCVSLFTLTTHDAARVLSVTEGYDAADAYSRKRQRSVEYELPGRRALKAMSAANRVPAGAAAAGVGAGGSAVVGSAAATLTGLRFGVPRADQLEFFGDSEYARLFSEAVARLESLGGERVEIDFAPFRAAAKLLYEGAFIAERYVAVGEFIERKPDSVHPVTRKLIAASRDLTAADAFRSQHQLMAAKRAAVQAWGDIDILVTPTTGTIYRIADVDADPIRLNANLGYYTNFVNFLDFAAVAVPAGFRTDGLPFGVTLIGAPWSESPLLSIAKRLHRASVTNLGATDAPLPTSDGPAAGPPIATAPFAVIATARATSTPIGATVIATVTRSPSPAEPIAATPSTPSAAALAPSAQIDVMAAIAPTRSPPSAEPAPPSLAIPATTSLPEPIPVAVCGAHLEGLPLNHQLTSRSATLLSRTRTAPHYRFYALPGGPPFRPGLVRVASNGAAIDVEVWSVPAEHFGSFVAGIPAPLGIGKVELEDGTRVPGFICENDGIEGAKDITSFGNWRAYLKSLSP